MNKKHVTCTNNWRYVVFKNSVNCLHGLVFTADELNWTELNCNKSSYSWTKVCRYNWHSAGSLGWPFSVLKYKYILKIKYTETVYQTALGNCYGLEITKMRSQGKGKRSIAVRNTPHRYGNSLTLNRRVLLWLATLIYFWINCVTATNTNDKKWYA